MQTLGNKLAKLAAKATIDTIGERLGGKTLLDIVGDAEAEALVDTLPNTIILGHVETEAQIDTVAEKIADVKAKTVGDTLNDVEA